MPAGCGAAPTTSARARCSRTSTTRSSRSFGPRPATAGSTWPPAPAAFAGAPREAGAEVTALDLSESLLAQARGEGGRRVDLRPRRRAVAAVRRRGVRRRLLLLRRHVPARFGGRCARARACLSPGRPYRPDDVAAGDAPRRDLRRVLAAPAGDYDLWGDEAGVEPARRGVRARDPLEPWALEATRRRRSGSFHVAAAPPAKAFLATLDEASAARYREAMLGYWRELPRATERRARGARRTSLVLGPRR